MRHLREAMGERPVYIVGYSNGGAIAVHYTLAALADSSLPMPAGVVLLSPEIGITRLAGLAKWQSRLGKVLGLRKLAWNSIGPEYDPFKYQSFALNAGRQAFEFTGEIQDLITELTPTGELVRFPKLLAFQSVVDATVLPEALVRDLFQRLPAGGHELVMFDVDRTDAIEQLYRRDPVAQVEQMFADASRQYAITLLTNRDPQSKAIVARHVGPRQTRGHGRGAGARVAAGPLLAVARRSALPARRPALRRHRPRTQCRHPHRRSRPPRRTRRAAPVGRRHHAPEVESFSFVSDRAGVGVHGVGGSGGTAVVTWPQSSRLERDDGPMKSE